MPLSRDVYKEFEDVVGDLQPKIGRSIKKLLRILRN